ncbi:uncharacterized protein LOC110854054 [Folsomia candida]|uniref:Bdellin B-3 n=1 Tax=Folsomia candida TaxID=158441 RepID=A0A226EVX5_FOLCA|nr:uncharacterized protein LOC110854054 [Folsomia candida]OXA61348.1 Bdellin B-3 [Folsomia candida]
MKFFAIASLLFFVGSFVLVPECESIEWSWAWFRDNFLPTRMDSDNNRNQATTPYYFYPTTARYTAPPTRPTTTTTGWAWDWILPSIPPTLPSTTRSYQPTQRSTAAYTHSTTTRRVTAPTVPPTPHGQANSQLTCSCGEETSEVCASNGITYKNRCKFDCAQHRVSRLRIVRNGSCDSVNRNDYWGNNGRK